MTKLIDYCREQGIGELWGNVLAENTAMLGLAKRFGFRERRDPDEPGVALVILPLGGIDRDQGATG